MVFGLSSFKYEQQYWDQNISSVAGIDEVGMGALAGPVCASAVIFDRYQIQNTKYKIPIIRDSKTLSAKQREKAAIWIKENASAWAVGQASVDEISHLNIRKASHLAMHRAVKELSTQPDILLIDGTPAQIHPTIPAVNIIDGDALCFSIAAASIIAKVHRDNLMRDLDKQFPNYGFASHKGYGSRQHLDALRKLGPTISHRSTYTPIRELLRVSP